MWRASLVKVYDGLVSHCQNITVPASEKHAYSPECEEVPSHRNMKMNLHIDIDISVVNCDAIDASLDLDNPVVLNLASPTRPGGGVRAGALAQEEELFRRTAYHRTLNLETGFYPLGEDEVVYSPDVPIILDADYTTTGEQRAVSFIACAGLRWPPHRQGKYFARDGDREMVRRKIMTILKVAHVKGHVNLVLGALGCGCFRSPPHETALLFKQCLQKYNNAFSKVVFAILDRDVANKQQLGPLATQFANVLIQDES
jgi:uncharacterized protein (TIGR02452 family)